MDRSGKIALVSSIVQQYEMDGAIFCVVNYSGMDAASDVALRFGIRQISGGMRVIKNTLHKRAIDKSKFSDIVPMLKGQIAVLWANDLIELAKVIKKYDSDLGVIKAICCSDGNTLYNRDSIMMLAKMPPLNTLRAQLLATLQRPAQSLAALLQESPSALVRILNARSNNLN